MPPPFIYADAIQITIAVIDNVLNNLLSAPGPTHAQMPSCFSERLLYESIINSVATWTPQRGDGAVNWGADKSPIYSPQSRAFNVKVLVPQTPLHALCHLPLRHLLPTHHDPNEIAYIIAVRWPWFVEPVLETNKRDIDLDADSEPPSEEIRMRLSRP